MDPKKWKQIKAVFDEAVELPTEKRECFLASISEVEVLTEVKKMLDSDAIDLYELSPVHELINESNGSDVPEKIGVYKIIREIGRGGMGAVYYATRNDGEFDHQVAIKVIKRGMDSDEVLRRFRNERQILAELQHPNIARLFDGGLSSDGSPFYAMEFIQGVPIDEYCRKKDISLKEKLELFRSVCTAVSYAHSQLIVHRDLKPSTDPDADYTRVAEWTRRGEVTCEVVYGANYRRLRANVKDLHPALDAWMITEGYGRTMSRPGLDLMRRELCVVAQTAVLETPRQLHSHLRGALHAGASFQQVDGALGVVNPLLSYDQWKKIKELWQSVRDGWEPEE